MSDHDPELAQVEAIYDALDRGEPEQALHLARAAVEAQPEDPVVRFLCGIALLEADRPWEAVEPLRRAVELDPDDAEFRAALGTASFRICDFRGAARAAEAALGSDPETAEAHHVRGLLLERRGELDAADEAFARASRLDPDRFAATPERVDRATFEREVERARDRLPPAFRARLEEVAVLVDDVPDEGLLRSESPPLDPELLGLFSGTPIGEQRFDGPVGSHPPQIHLFRRNLERFALRREELAEQIAVTLYHELGHYLGMEEEDLEALDFD